MKRILQLILILIVLSSGFAIQQVAEAETNSNIGKFEYEGNSLKPTDSTGYPPEEKKDPNPVDWVLNKLGIPDVDLPEPIKKAVGDTFEWTKEKVTDAYEWTKGKVQDGMEAANEWWGEQNKFTKSLIILGGGAVILAGAVVLTPLAGTAALVMGAGGALSYGLYAASTDNVSFWGGMAFMGLGMVPGGAGWLARGTTAAAWGARGASVAGSGLRFVGGLIGRTGMIGGGISAGFAGGTHLYNHFVHGQPLDAGAMVQDMVVWGAAGTIAGPLGRGAMKGASALLRSRVAGMSVGSGVAGGSEYSLGNIFKGKAPNLKTAATVTVIAATIPLAVMGATHAVPLIKGNPAQVALSSTQVSDTTVSQAGKTTTNVVDTSVSQSATKTRTIIDGNNHITVNPVKTNIAAPNVGVNKPVAGDNLSLNLKQNINTKNQIGNSKIKINEVNYGDHIVKQGRKKVLQSNIRYVTPEGYKYQTDELGRIKSVEGTLSLGKAKRNTYAQRTVGGNDRLSNDDGGHLVASIFKGSGEIDNLVPMDANLNRGAFKTIENEWAKALNNGDEVEINVKPIFKGDSLRPEAFSINYSINDIKVSKFLKNSSKE
ncbi:DNA/RNA non-specific endonuclease [Pseudalkalibacillus sp. Hm43]|uniref:DNA/RNA non-specific endonuclease n=1 Tax=Pseudalkalibacillus sp. Hm43 TaxID=3450742 RepID=UPI003F41C21A